MISEIIKFEGIIKSQKLIFMRFSREMDGTIKYSDIPIDQSVADRIMKYIGSLLPPVPKIVEIGNDEEAE